MAVKFSQMDKDKLENDLANAIMMILIKHIKTGYDEKGMGEFLQCKINFKYLHNAGGAFVRDLEFTNEPSTFRVSS